MQCLLVPLRCSVETANNVCFYFAYSYLSLGPSNLVSSLKLMEMIEDKGGAAQAPSPGYVLLGISRLSPDQW